MLIKIPVTHGDPRTWIAAIYDAIEAIDTVTDDSDDGIANRDDIDDLYTVAAWLCDDYGYDPKDFD